MKFLLIVFCFAGCMPKTTVYGPTGLKQFETNADSTTLSFNGPGTSLVVTDLNHSIAIRNIGRAITSVFTAFGGWLTTLSLLKP
jgi:hypothetical protein